MLIPTATNRPFATLNRNRLNAPQGFMLIPTSIWRCEQKRRSCICVLMPLRASCSFQPLKIYFSPATQDTRLNAPQGFMLIPTWISCRRVTRILYPPCLNAPQGFMLIPTVSLTYDETKYRRDLVLMPLRASCSFQQYIIHYMGKQLHTKS